MATNDEILKRWGCEPNERHGLLSLAMLLDEARKDEQNTVIEDIKKMLLVISAFTKEATQGEDLLQEWQRKYLRGGGKDGNE